MPRKTMKMLNACHIGAAALLCALAVTPATAAPIGGSDWFIGIITENKARHLSLGGTFIEDFSGLTEVRGIDYGPDGDIYIGDNNNQIGRFANTNFQARTTVVGSSEINSPMQVRFGPDRDLYCIDTSLTPDRIKKWEGPLAASPFTYDGLFTASRADLIGMQDFEFGSDGDIYMSNWKTPGVIPNSSIERFDGTSGAWIESYVSTNEPNLDIVLGITFGPDGNLYVANYPLTAAPAGEILRYQGPNGASPGTFIDIFVANGSGGLDLPQGIAFGSDSNLYVCGNLSKNVLRYQGPSGGSPGALIDVFTTFTGNPLFITQVPPLPGPPSGELDNSLQVVDLSDLDGDLPLAVSTTTQILWQTQDWEHGSFGNPSWPSGGGDSVGYPTMVKNTHGLNQDGKYYLYYAHHDPMSGIGCAVADSITGPYTKISSTDSKVLTVPNYNPAGPNPGDPSHYSSPCVVWNGDEQLWFMYFHYFNHFWGGAGDPPGEHWSENNPGLGHQMTALATCPDLSSHNWTIWTDPVWSPVSVWNIVPVLHTTDEAWMESASSYHAIQRLPNGQWLAFMRGTPDVGGPTVGFGTSTNGRDWTYFPENPVIGPGKPWTVVAGEYRPKFIGYLGNGEYLVAWAEHSNPHVIYSKTTDFKTFQRDSRGYATWGVGDGGLVTAWREGDRLYLFSGKTVCEMVLPLLDHDGDGMHDDWEVQYFGSTTVSSGGSDEDRDGDGFRDVYEFEAGTDPTNANSLLTISTTSSDGNANVVLQWQSVSNKSYSVLCSTSVTGSWSLSASNLVGTPPLNVSTVDVGSVRKFLKIGLDD